MKKNWRLYVVIAVFFALGAALESRLFSLQVNDNAGKNAVIAEKTQTLKRGTIYLSDKTGRRYAVALNKEGFKVWAENKKIKNPLQVATMLAPLLNEEINIISEKLDVNNQQYQEISDFVDKEVGQKIKALKIEGINLEKKDLRIYPFQTLAANLLGFVSYKTEVPEGQYGIEEFYDAQLSGADEVSNTGVLAGKSLLLSVDYNIQLAIEKVLEKLIQKNEAESGAVVVLDPKTGEVLALASYPYFNPNKYREANLEDFRNYAIQENYEPGSVIKLLTMAAGLQEKIVTPSTTYEDKGFVKVKGTVMRNFDGRGRGIQTMNQVLEQSLNTGAVFVEEQVNKLTFLSYFKKFGAGQRTGVDIAGETKGDIRNLFNFNDVDYAAASFGQGITATPIQIASMVGSIANNGVMMQPYVMKSMLYSDNTQEDNSPKIIGNTINSLTASQLTGMMVRIVENGYDKQAKIPGYLVAAKTGTAQVADLEKGGYTEDNIHTIAGFAPAYNPKFVVVIRLDKPKGASRFASNTLAPSFRETVQFLLNYYQIPPSEPLNPKK